jgi:hypothetical protein
MGERRIWAGAVIAPLFLLVLPVLLVLLAACGGGGDSVADPPVSPSSTSSSPTVPPKHESPQAFIRRWAAEDTRMQNSGETSTFRSLSRGCSGCKAVADRVDAIYAAGGNVRTRGWAIVRDYQSAQHGQSRTVELIVDSAPTAYVPSQGASVKHLQGGREHFQVLIAPASGSWVVTRFVQVEA